MLLYLKEDLKENCNFKTAKLMVLFQMQLKPLAQLVKSQPQQLHV